MIDTTARKHVQSAFDGIARFCKLTKLHPNSVTVFAFLLGIASCIFLGLGHTWIAVILLWFSGIFDVLDGTVARLTGKSSNVGAYLDMIFDRLVECFIILAFYFLKPEFTLSYFIFLIGVIFNFSTFMLAGNLFKNTGIKSMHYDIGLVERTECFIAFSLMMIFPSFIPYFINIFNILMILTGILRMYRIIKYQAINKN